MKSMAIEGFRLAPQQRRIWSLRQAGSFYNSQIALSIAERVEVSALQKALQKQVRRHQILRTRFRSLPGMKFPVQVISDDDSIEWEDRRMLGLEPNEHEAEVVNILADCRRRAFDLDRGPLLRAAICGPAPDKRLLILTIPALCGDLVSLNQMAVEINRLLSSRQDDNPTRETIQYLQFSEWQNDSLGEIGLDPAGQHWTWFRPDDLLDLRLPFELRSDPAAPFDPHSNDAEIDAEQTGRIEALARGLGASSGAVLMASLAVLIWRLTGNPNLVIGHGCDGRGLEEIQEAVGPFATYLPLHCRLEDSPSFLDLVRRIHQASLEGYRRQHHFSWENLQRGAAPDRKQAQYFPLCFELWRQSKDEQRLRGPLSFHSSHSFGDRFKLRLFCAQAKDGLHLRFDYDSHLFMPEDVRRLMGCFQALLDDAINNPQASIAGLNLLTEVERRIVSGFNDTAASYPSDLRIHDLIEAEAARRPEAMAVVCEGQSLTYRELNARANQLANFLRNLEVGPEVPVAICLDRSLEMMVGILGILKAGGAYLPLNPDLPPERLALILRDSGAAVLLTQKRLLDSFGERHLKTVSLDADGEKIASAPASGPSTSVEAHHLAYIIYTSGSTGRPKGVMVTHRNLVHSTYARFHYYREPVTSFMLLSPFSFDSSIAGIFWTLCQGGTLVLPANDFHQDPSRFISSVAHNNVSHLLCVPSLYDALLQHPERSRLSCLKIAIVAGESCPAGLVTRHRKALPQTLLFNEYGPTECAVWSSVHRLVPGAPIEGGPPIGKPIANTQIHLLDSRLRPVPVGCAAEIYVGGAGVSRGYLWLPALTAERFIPDPFSAEAGARMYRTGDMGRYLPDGVIEFLGRIDNQVKIRGFRIELEEIESVLKQHPEVRNAVVMVIHSATTEVPSRIVAYLILKSPSRAPGGLTAEIRDFLAGKLPAPMIPSAFTVMDGFPLTPNGKVDRKALPVVDELISFQERPHVAPQGDLEQLLVGVWREVLDVERVGRHDNFFELGGDSIKGILLISRMQERLGKQVDVGALLQAPNIAEMASYLAASHSIEFDPHNLEAETVLDPEICPAAIASRPLSETRSVFLTGATGFLGAFLLQSILRGTAADIFCLVRSRNAGEGAGKIRNALESYSLWEESFRSRIIPVPGDLSRPLLGLSPEEFRLLASKVDLIYHNGALVNFVYPYTLLKPVNVLGTQEVLRLASLIRAKPVHYISTISVFSSIGEQTVIREEDEPAPPISGSELPLGYAQSKWVAEKLVAEARSRGLPVSVYRPGRITGHSLTGVSSPDDFACRFIRGCVQLGAIPDWDGEVNIIPVDYASQAIVHLSMGRESTGKVFHLMNPRSVRWDEIVGWFRSYGFSIRQVTYREWREGIERSPDNALYPLLATFPHDEGDDDRAVPEVSSQKRVIFDCQNTLAGLKNSPVICPPADFALIDAYLSYLVRRGVLDAPSPIESGKDSIITPGVAA